MRIVASRGTLARFSKYDGGMNRGSKLRLLSTEFASSGLEGKLSMRVASRGISRVSGGNAKGVYEVRSLRLLRREHQTRSLGLFADSGSGITHRMLKELEKKAARAPSDSNAEVKQTHLNTYALNHIPVTSSYSSRLCVFYYSQAQRGLHHIIKTFSLTDTDSTPELKRTRRFFVTASNQN